MKTTKSNPHAWLFAYMSKIEGYKQYGDVIKASLVADYSDGETESLKELYEKYPKKYARMRAELSSTEIRKFDKMDIARKRVIAVLFDYLKLNGYYKNIEYVKQTACNAAQVREFNKIPAQKLDELYRKFGKKKESVQDQWAIDVLDKISKDL